MTGWAASAKWAEGPALDDRPGALLAFRLSARLGAAQVPKLIDPHEAMRFEAKTGGMWTRAVAVLPSIADPRMGKNETVRISIPSLQAKKTPLTRARRRTNRMLGLSARVIR